MCKAIFNCLGKTSGIAGSLKLAGLLFLAMTATTTWAVGTNDNLANATIIAGPTGSTNGNNVGATAEPGEPVDAGDGGGKSIWYSWTATQTGTEQFTTEGSAFDTVIGVYTGTNVTNLTLIAQNDDVAFPNDLTSAVNFPVVAGQTYVISVDGNEGDSGTVVLNWQPTGVHSAGQYSFAVPHTGLGAQQTFNGSPLYVVTDTDYLPNPYGFMNPLYPGGVNGVQQMAVRVVRTNGNAGKVTIGYSITNLFYTNLYTTNFYGTNVFTTNLSDGSFSNVFTTNVVSVNQISNFYRGQFNSCLITNAYVFSITNISGQPLLTGPTNSLGTNTSLPIPCVTSSTNFFVTNGTAVSLVTSNIFCIRPSPTNPATFAIRGIPTAIPNVHYAPKGGILTNIDFQMGADALYSLQQFGLVNGGDTNISNLDPTNLANHLIVITLTNVTLDPSESTNDIALPSIVTSNAYVEILNSATVGVDNGTPNIIGLANECSTAAAVVNFARSVNWVDENNNHIAKVYAHRSGTNFSGSMSVNYTTFFRYSDRLANALNTFVLQPASEYATPPNPNVQSRENQHYALADGTVSWGGNDGADKEIVFSITNDPAVQFNEDIIVELRNPTGCVLGQLTNATLTILFNNDAAGAVDRNHNTDNHATTVPHFNSSPGAGNNQNTVYAAIVQPDTNTIIAGDFVAYNTFTNNRIARMLFNGQADTNFLKSPNSGANNTITCLALQPDGKIIIGGVFNSFNATPRAHIARLNTDGSLDTNFNPGLGFDGTVWAVALQPNNQIVVGGDFAHYNATNRANLARLNSDGSIDLTFNPGVGPNGIIRALALQNDGNIVVGGDFTSIDSTNFEHIARVNSTGGLDPSFNPGLGADNTVLALTEQPDGKVLVGGQFATINLTSRNSIARLNSNGSIDTTFDPGVGCDDLVRAIALQPDGEILIGGTFTSYNMTRRVGIARLYSNGPLDTTFMDTAYNQFAGLVNTIHNQQVQPKNSVFTIAVQSDTNIIIGGRFSLLGGNNLDSVLKRDHFPITRQNVARLLGVPTPGPGNIGLDQGSYTADKTDEQLYISLQRVNGFLGPASVTFSPNPLHAGAGNAAPGVDYLQNNTVTTWPTTYPNIDWLASDAFDLDNFQDWDPFHNTFSSIPNPTVTILNNTNSTGNLGLNLQLTQPSGGLFLGGEPIPTGVALGLAAAPMTIVDDTIQAGALSFTSFQLYVNESSTNAVITVTRSGGDIGTVSAEFKTLTGLQPLPGGGTTNYGTAFPGATNDFIAVDNTLVFGPGETVKTFTVPIVDNFVFRQPDRYLTLILTNFSGGAVGGTYTNSQLSIINDNFSAGHLSFTSANYASDDNTPFTTISVMRQGGSAGTITVAFNTADGSGVAGTDYVATNGVLSWGNGVTTPMNFNVALLNPGTVNSNVTVNLQLSQFKLNNLINSNLIGLNTNATLTITNENEYGNPTFSTSNYFVNENAGSAVITVNRLGGSSQTITVDYSIVDGTAVNGTDYSPITTSGTLTFTNGQISQSFTIPIIDNEPQTNNGAFFTMVLSNPTPAAGPKGGVVIGTPSIARVTIIANEVVVQPPGAVDTTFSSDAAFNATVFALALQGDGSIIAGGDFTQANGIARNRIARLNSNGALDPKFSQATGGANGSVRALDIQTDGQILVSGLFTTLNGVNQNYIARLNFNGSLDSTFNTGTGADNPVYAIGETFVGNDTSSASRKIIIGGSFASVGTVAYRSVARLNQDGTVDTSFNAVGANGTVYALAIYSTNDNVNGGKILIGGDFTMVNGTNVNHVARLNADGTLDTSFNNITVTSGPVDSVRAIAIQVDGKVVIGGLFQTVSGTPFNYIARLDTLGQVDPSFNIGVGANGPVTALALQQDNDIVVGGSFTQCSGVTRNRLTRLNPDGTVDASINFGTGANDFISAVVVQPDTRLVVGGNFTQFAGVPKQRIVRLYGGSEVGSGEVEFTTGNYQVNENATNALITISRVGGTGADGQGGYQAPVVVTVSTADGTAIAGTDYQAVTTNVTFNPGETLQVVSIPILNDLTNNGLLTLSLSLTDPQSGLPIVSPQNAAFLNIIGANSTVSFATANYTVNKNVAGSNAVITISRNNSTIGPASIDFFTTTNGTATPGVDYTAVTNTVSFVDGQSNATVNVPIINNGLPEGNLTLGLALINPTNTVLDTALPTVATLTIVDNNLSPGNVKFSASSYTNLQTKAFAIIPILRTNGSANTISINYATSGGTAVAGIDYLPTNGTLSFLDGQTSNAIVVAVLDNTNLSTDVTVNLVLSQPSTGVGIVGPASVPLTIVNQNFDFSFAQAGYFVDEKNGSITVGVNRLGNTTGTNFVSFATTNGTALNGVNYITTSGSLTFLPGQTFQSFTVPIIYDPQITGNLIFLANLSVSNGSPVQLISPFTTTITVLDDDSGFSFGTVTNTVIKGNTSAFIPVFRTGNNAGSASVTVTTSGGTAVANVEYVPTNGVLTFVSGQTSNAFPVTILNDNQIDGDQTVGLVLSAPSASAQLLAPSNTVLTIIDNESGFSFSAPTYLVNENGVTALITVNRSGFTNSIASVQYATTNGTANSGSQYQSVGGTLTFTNGQTSLTFSVPIIDNNVTGGSETVLLLLSNPSAGSTLVNPNAATLTILNNDNSLIVAAGSAVLQPANGVITNGAAVTALFSLLNSAGETATNVTATILSTNGITATGTTTQNYGNLLVGGPSVFRQFTFNVSPTNTNGGSISVVLQLHYGTNVNNVSFSYVLGSTTNTFTNSSLITINDLSAATPYPATITINSLSGVINSVTATVNKLGHSFVSDVSILLVGPGGQKTLLMEQNGGSHTITNVNLTFDSSASNVLFTNIPVSGVYLPSPLQTNIVFHTSTNGITPPPAPYSTSLTNFVGSNPNGTWSLYVDDTRVLNAGSINGGWSLAITTLNIVAPNNDLVVGLSSAANTVVASSNLVYTVTVTNAGPSPATGVSVSNALPAGTTVSSVVSSQGTFSTNGGVLTLSIGSLANNATASVTVTLTTSTNLTLLTNVVTVTGNETEDNPVNNTATLVTPVSAPSADLALGVSVSPNVSFVGTNNNVTVTLTVTNFGPATATSPTVTNTLPAGLSLVSNTAVSSTNNGAGLLTFTLPNLGSGLTESFTVVLHPTLMGTNTVNFGVASTVPDAFKANNTAAAKIILQFVPLSVSLNNGSLKFSWPVAAGSYQLQATTRLASPNWTNVTTGPVNNGTNFVVTLPTSNGTNFFRLKGQ